MDLEQLLDLGTEELIQLLPARARRRIGRGLKRKPLALIKKLREAKKNAPAGEWQGLARQGLAAAKHCGGPRLNTETSTAGREELVGCHRCSHVACVPHSCRNAVTHVARGTGASATPAAYSWLDGVEALTGMCRRGSGHGCTLCSCNATVVAVFMRF